VARTVWTTTRHTVSRSRSVRLVPKGLSQVDVSLMRGPAYRSVSPNILRVTVSASRSPTPQPHVRVTLEPNQPAPVVVRTRSLSPLPPANTGSLHHTGTRAIVSPSINGRRFISRTSSPGFVQPPAPPHCSQPQLRAPSIERFTVSFSPATSPCRSPTPRPVPRPSPVVSPREVRRVYFHPTMSTTSTPNSSLVRLRRLDTSTPWGFRLNGGAEYGQPLYIHHVTSRSIAHRVGLHAGDAILQVGVTPTNGMTHLAAKSEILRAGNELDFIIQRGAVHLTHTVSSSQPSSQVMTTSAPHWTGPAQDPGVQSRSFLLLQKELGV